MLFKPCSRSATYTSPSNLDFEIVVPGVEDVDALRADEVTSDLCPRTVRIDSHCAGNFPAEQFQDDTREDGDCLGVALYDEPRDGGLAESRSVNRLDDDLDVRLSGLGVFRQLVLPVQGVEHLLDALAVPLGNGLLR